MANPNPKPRNAAKPAEQAAAPEAAAPEAAAPVAETVTVFVPRAFRLRLDNHHEILVKAGVQEMTREQADHWYSQANGVKIHTK